MPFLGWSLLGLGGLFLLGTVTGNSPWSYIVAAIRGEATPEKQGFGGVHPDPKGNFSGGNPFKGDQASKRQQVVAFARSAIGLPYRFGSSGPYSYDCSGLTLRAYDKVGIKLPHSASLQSARARRIAQPQLGDLVFWGVPAHHCGIYSGDGKVIHAPDYGQLVKEQAIWGNPYYGTLFTGTAI